MSKLHFKDGEHHMNVATFGKWPLRIAITGPGVGASHSYIMNDNEIIALYNMLHDILTKKEAKDLEDARQSAAYSNLHD